MDTNAKGQLGGIECSESARKRIATESGAFTCPTCRKSNADIIKEREEAAKLIEAKNGKRKEETVPEELRLAYRDELGNGAAAQETTENGHKEKQAAITPSPIPASTTHARSASNAALRPTRPAQPAVQQLTQRTHDRSLAWIDAGIYGVVAALLFMVFRKLF